MQCAIRPTMSEGGGYAREKGESVERDGTMCMSPCVHYVNVSFGMEVVRLN